MPFLLSSTEVLRNRYIWTNWDATSSKKNDFFEVFQLGLIDYLAFYFMNITHVQKLNHLQNFIPAHTPYSIQYTYVNPVGNLREVHTAVGVQGSIHTAKGSKLNAVHIAQWNLLQNL